MKYKQCKWCGRYFIDHGTRREYCTTKCRVKFNRLLEQLEAEREYRRFGREKPKYIGVGI